jgi:hypothetical protein
LAQKKPNGRRAKDGQASPRWVVRQGIDRKDKDEEQGASREHCWLRNAPKQNNDKNNKQRSMSDPAPHCGAFSF